MWIVREDNRPAQNSHSYTVLTGEHVHKHIDRGQGDSPRGWGTCSGRPPEPRACPSCAAGTVGPTVLCSKGQRPPQRCGLWEGLTGSGQPHGCSPSSNWSRLQHMGGIPLCQERASMKLRASDITHGSSFKSFVCEEFQLHSPNTDITHVHTIIQNMVLAVLWQALRPEL